MGSDRLKRGSPKGDTRLGEKNLMFRLKLYVGLRRQARLGGLDGKALQKRGMSGAGRMNPKFVKRRKIFQPRDWGASYTGGQAWKWSVGGLHGSSARFVKR